MRILISGAGIAGPTLAWWLERYGFTVTLVESAPSLRSGGYVIDFWGAGFEVAERMGLVEEIRRRGYEVREVRAVNAQGRRVASFSANAFSRMTQGRYASLGRGDLSTAIFGRLQVETIFGDSIQHLGQTRDGVIVIFGHTGARQFDLVIGADGLHSCVRRLVFGEQERFERYLGFKAAAFGIGGYRPRDELVYVMFTRVNQQVARFALRDGSTMFLFTFRDQHAALPATIEGQRAVLREHFGKSGWECPQILEALERCEEVYFDRVSQIRMDPRTGLWTRGRVTLVGDAASCVSLLAGQGSALAMVAAYILAGELKRADGDYARAFARYQELFGPFVLKKQNAALRLANFFAPPSRLALGLRNQAMNLMRIPCVAEIAFGRDLADRIVLPDYERSA